MNTINFFNKHSFSKNISWIILTIVIFFFDRVTKIKIINSQIDQNIKYINDYLNFELVWNGGIGFGLLSLNAGLAYNIVSLVIFIVILFVVFLIINGSKADKILYSMILGGAIGNFYDRIFYFAVPDFIDLHFNNYHWFTFNIADIFISLGIILFIIKELNFKKNDKK